MTKTNRLSVLFLVLCIITFQKASAQYIPRDWTIQVTTTVQTSPPAITFSWVPLSEGSRVTIYRKAKTDLAWSVYTANDKPMADLPGTATTYTDYNVVVGQGYDYYIKGFSNNSNPYTYVYAAIELAQTDYKGKLILLVDDSFSSSLYTELNQLMSDMTGDGWQVIRQDVSRTATVPSVKALIKGIYNADPTNVKAVFLFGHVPVPYSGGGGWDGHSDHSGAWPADGYYADMIGTWTDNIENTTQATRKENWNILGAGK